MAILFAFYDFMDFREGNLLIREKIGQKIAQTNGMAMILCAVSEVAAAGPSALQIRQGMFLFCGRRTDRIKALYWEGDGFLLLYKRLEKGKFQWPRSENEALGITAQQYRWLMRAIM